jgi:hypothetical protein
MRCLNSYISCAPGQITKPAKIAQTQSEKATSTGLMDLVRQDDLFTHSHASTERHPSNRRITGVIYERVTT